MASEKLVYGGYVSFPLAPKDVKAVKALCDQYTTMDDLFSLIHGFAEDEWGIKIEPLQETGGWKVVVYNLVPTLSGDNHAYYVSGESDTLLKALCVVKYKLEQIPTADFSKWVSAPLKGEFR